MGNGASYTYGSKPHAVTAVGSTSYAYDDNGNMTTRGTQTITWDVENRPVSVSYNGTASTFIYDGDGNRGKKTEGGETILYINRYYEKNLTSGNVTAYYYLGERLVAMKKGTDLQYIHQDHLSGTVLATSDNGTSLGTITYYPYGSIRSGSIPTDKKFTGQRLDETGLYYYSARYYDASVGRFISADTLVQDFTNSQAWNRYSYVINNPLKLIDPTGNYVEFTGGFSYRSGRNKAILELAWKMLEWAATDLPKLAEIMQKAEESEALVKIGWSPLPEKTGSVVLGDERIGRQSVWIDTSLVDADIRLVAKTMAHELYHVDEGRQTASIQEEMEAYEFEYEVGERLCLPMEDTTTTELHGLDPKNPDDVDRADIILSSKGGLYRYFPPYPFNINDPYLEAFIFFGYMVFN